ncbi:hypothetical protein [Clostridium sp. CCUG 7971]|uniref:hypothetical protein n=1 Tax=Clostridium sp. CCUG 7971 TaxID=2811414 RepID=UPI001ABBA8A9|nr:hypothetical protein [Clostridium sp. CCUG 7971]MBO3446335.1 hypothetical protein [Clostridium sp. CCUG 7971]
MSLYLGKIHYWLFNKILWFEGLEDEIIEVAKSEGLDIDKLSKEINLKFGEKLPNKPLEEIIEHGNIHGWLQDKIHSAEGRMATWTSEILKRDKDAITKIEKVYIDQGIKAGKEIINPNIDLSDASKIYNKINDYILDGMPCDRVDEVIVSSEDRVEWKKRLCVHKDIWNNAGADVSLFYELRNLWIKSFVNTISNDFVYKEEENGVKIIERN